MNLHLWASHKTSHSMPHHPPPLIAAKLQEREDMPKGVVQVFCEGIGKENGFLVNYIPVIVRELGL